jgi:hypothetical protein
MFKNNSGVFRFLFAKFLSMLLKLLYTTPFLKGFIFAFDLDLDFDFGFGEFGEFGYLLLVSFCNFLELQERTGKLI